jgi:hypothetical protein
LVDSVVAVASDPSGGGGRESLAAVPSGRSVSRTGQLYGRLATVSTGARTALCALLRPAPA